MTPISDWLYRGRRIQIVSSGPQQYSFRLVDFSGIPFLEKNGFRTAREAVGGAKACVDERIRVNQENDE